MMMMMMHGGECSVSNKRAEEQWYIDLKPIPKKGDDSK